MRCFLADSGGLCNTGPEAPCGRKEPLAFSEGPPTLSRFKLFTAELESLNITRKRSSISDDQQQPEDFDFSGAGSSEGREPEYCSLYYWHKKVFRLSCRGVDGNAEHSTFVRLLLWTGSTSHIQVHDRAGKSMKRITQNWQQAVTLHFVMGAYEEQSHQAYPTACKLTQCILSLKLQTPESLTPYVAQPPPTLKPPCDTHNRILYKPSAPKLLAVVTMPCRKDEDKSPNGHGEPLGMLLQ